MNIILIGMPASGKSTVGVILAKALGMDFVDTDLLLQKATGQKLSQLIAERGLDGFLEAEEQVCLGFQPDHTVIATGGSAVYSEKAMQHFQENGRIVYLQTELETLKARLQDFRQRGVVLREGQTIDSLYEERTVLYRKWADIIVPEEGLSMEETVNAVVEALRSGRETD